MATDQFCIDVARFSIGVAQGVVVGGAGIGCASGGGGGGGGVGGNRIVGVAC